MEMQCDVVGNGLNVGPMIRAGGALMAHGGPRWGDGPPVGHCAPKSDLRLDGSDRCRTSVVGRGILMF